MSKTGMTLSTNRIHTAARQVARRAGELSVFWGGNADRIRTGASSEASGAVASGLIDKTELPDVARELLRRGTDWNPFNNFGVVTSTQAVLPHPITGTDLREAAAAVAALAKELDICTD